MFLDVDRTRVAAVKLASFGKHGSAKMRMSYGLNAFRRQTASHNLEMTNTSNTSQHAWHDVYVCSRSFAASLQLLRCLSYSSSVCLAFNPHVQSALVSSNQSLRAALSHHNMKQNYNHLYHTKLTLISIVFISNAGWSHIYMQKQR